MTVTDADRILSAGTTIEVDGEEVRLRFRLLALKRCEDTYGNLDGTLAELAWLAGQATAGFPDPVAGRVAVLLQQVLDTDEPIDADTTPARCIGALMDAWVEAFPAPDPGHDAAPKGRRARRSRGTTGGGSPA